MTKIVTYLDDCKKKLGISSTYGLAKALDLDVRRVQEFYKNIGATNEYLCFKMAEILELDPAFIIADIKSETEKDEAKREFFKSIAGSLSKTASTVALIILCSIVSLPSLFIENAGAFFKRRDRFV